MTDTTKKYALILLATVGTALGVVSQCVQEGTVVPVPVVSSSPAPLPSGPTPVPSVSGAPTPVPSTVVVSPSQPPSPAPGSLTLSGSRGEVLGALLELALPDGCTTLGLSLPGVTATFREVRTITTTQPSAEDLRPGTYYAPLVPATTVCGPTAVIWMDVAIPDTHAPGMYLGAVTLGGTAKLSISLKVWKLTMPKRPTLPVYAEVHSQGILGAHGLGTANTSVQGPLTKLFIDAARAHRIEPYKQWVVFQPPVKADGTIDLDQYGADASPRTLGVNGAISPVMIPTFYGSGVSNFPSDSYLQAIQKTITANGLTDAWTYLWDEPSEAEMVEVVRRAEKVKQFAPGLKVMVTTEERDTLLGKVDIFAPVMDHFKIPGHRLSYRPGYWLYTSCMEHSCGMVGPSSGVPGLVLDRPLVHGRAFTHVAAALGAKAALYYNLTEAYQRQDLWVDPWVKGPGGIPFGGNYDGVLLLPSMTGSPKRYVQGMSAPGPVETLMMKYVRQGSFDQEYFRMAELNDPAWAQTLRLSLVRTQFDWSKDPAAYDKVREQIGDRLGGI